MARRSRTIRRSPLLVRKSSFSANWSLIAKFDGEFANGSQTCAGTGMLRYAW